MNFGLNLSNLKRKCIRNKIYNAFFETREREVHKSFNFKTELLFRDTEGVCHQLTNMWLAVRQLVTMALWSSIPPPLGVVFFRDTSYIRLSKLITPSTRHRQIRLQFKHYASLESAVADDVISFFYYYYYYDHHLGIGSGTAWSLLQETMTALLLSFLWVMFRPVRGHDTTTSPT